MFNTHKPARNCFVNERGFRTPAKWIIVLCRALVDHTPSFFQVFAYKFICILAYNNILLDVLLFFKMNLEVVIKRLLSTFLNIGNYLQPSSLIFFPVNQQKCNPNDKLLNITKQFRTGRISHYSCQITDIIHIYASTYARTHPYTKIYQFRHIHT